MVRLNASGLPSLKHSLVTSFRSAARFCRSSVTWTRVANAAAGRDEQQLLLLKRVSDDRLADLLGVKDIDIDGREHFLMAGCVGMH